MTLNHIALLTPNETTLAKNVRRQHQKSGKKWRSLYKTQPSTFIDPRWIDDLAPELKSALFQGTILIAVVKGTKQSHLALALIDKNAPMAELVQSLLQHFKIGSMLCDPKKDAEQIEAFVSAMIGNKEALLTSKRVTNAYERWLLSTTDLALMRRANQEFQQSIPDSLKNFFQAEWLKNRLKFRVFHEVALPAFIDFDLATPNLEIDINFALASRVDLLVTGEAPDYIPLLAMEFDGPDHRTHRGIDKDSKKDAIFREAGIPLLRISFEDSPSIGPKKVVIDLADERTKREKESFLKQLISSIGRSMHTKRVERPRLWQPYLERFGEVYKVSEQQFMKEHSVIALPDQVRLELYEQVNAALAEHEDTIRESIDLDDHLDKLNIDERLDPGQRKILKQAGIFITDFSWRQNSSGGVYCRAICHQGENQQVIKTPAVHCRGIDSDEFDFKAILREQLKIWLIDSAENAAEAQVAR
jgi:hypothetical protein